jgi:hypothetical protein
LAAALVAALLMVAMVVLVAGQGLAEQVVQEHLDKATQAAMGRVAQRHFRAHQAEGLAQQAQTYRRAGLD